MPPGVLDGGEHVEVRHLNEDVAVLEPGETPADPLERHPYGPDSSRNRRGLHGFGGVKGSDG